SLDEIRQKLDQVVDTERRGIRRRQEQDAPGSSDPFFRELLDPLSNQRLAQLDQLPSDLGGRLQALRDYDFLEPEARQQFEGLLNAMSPEMRRELEGMLDAVFRDQALQQELRRLGEAMQAMFPGFGEVGDEFSGGESVSLRDALKLMGELDQIGQAERELL